MLKLAKDAGFTVKGAILKAIEVEEEYLVELGHVEAANDSRASLLEEDREDDDEMKDGDA